jgi:transcriptional regulator with XRE-family HTH domain
MENADYLKRFGKNISLNRQKLSISQRHFSRVCEIDQSYISRIELGIANVTVSTLCKLSLYLKTPVKSLLDLNKYKKLN